MTEDTYYALPEGAGGHIDGHSEVADSAVRIISPQSLMCMDTQSLYAIFDSAIILPKGDIADFTDYYKAHKAQRDNFVQ